uniref:Uncharacterized protein n=1 Tax=Daphnia galeata TaxID=27404 RepID=A0A8J2S864_9CRUS|nr:unnamed protein product [Daphnia galeata]
MKSWRPNNLVECKEEILIQLFWLAGARSYFIQEIEMDKSSCCLELLQGSLTRTRTVKNCTLNSTFRAMHTKTTPFPDYDVSRLKTLETASTQQPDIS